MSGRANPLRIVASGAIAPAPTFAPLYLIGEINHCPGCSNVQWFVSRVLAECASCGAALTIAKGVPLRG